MKLLITGTGGFVGRNLKEYLHAQYSDLKCPRSNELDLTDTVAVANYLMSNKFDVVIHCAVNIASIEQNLRMYFNLERCSGHFGRMLSVGSGAEYDSRHYIPKMKEDYFGKHVPVDIYGLSKFVVAKDIESLARNIYNLRVFGIFGKYEDYRRRFISNNIFRVLSGLDISVNRNMRFDYLYVDDFCKLVDIFIQADPVRRSYNVCTGNSIDLMSIAEIIREVHGADVKICVKQEGMNTEYSGDNSLVSCEFGPFDFTPIRKAVEDLYRWYIGFSGLQFDAV